MKWRWIAVACALTGLICILVGLKQIPIGVVGEWVWPYTKVAFWDRAFAPVVFLCLLVGLVALAVSHRALTRIEAALVLVLIVFFGFGLQLTTGQLGSAGLHEDALVTLGPWTGGYHLESYRVKNMSQYLAAYPEIIRAMSVKGTLAHVSNHPPGYVVFYWVLDRITAASEGFTETLLWIARHLGPFEADVVKDLGIQMTRSQEAGVWLSCLMLRLSACLCAIPVYFLVRRTHGARAGILSAAFATMVPAFHSFSPYPDALILFLAPCVIYFWDKALGMDRAPRAGLMGACAGALAFVAVFLTLAVLVLGPIALLMSAVRGFHQKQRGSLWRNFLAATVGLLGAFFAMMLALWLTTHCNLFRVFMVCFEKHTEFYEAVHRTYRKWLLWNMADFVLFLGVPLMFLVIKRLAAASSVIQLFEERILFAATLSLIVLNFLGLNRGEAARLWMVFMPFFCIGAAAWADVGPRKLAALMLAQGAQVIIFKLCLDVFSLASLV